MDLYITTLEFGEWSEPSNLGGAVNTEQDEAFPFLHPNGVLFFTSEAHGSLGGLDIFACLLRTAERWLAAHDVLWLADEGGTWQLTGEDDTSGRAGPRIAPPQA